MYQKIKSNEKEDVILKHIKGEVFVIDDILNIYCFINSSLNRFNRTFSGSIIILISRPELPELQDKRMYNTVHVAVQCTLYSYINLTGALRSLFLNSTISENCSSSYLILFKIYNIQNKAAHKRTTR